MIADETFDEKINYEVAANYWSQIPATVDGMLVGFGYITKADIEGSEKFLKDLFKAEASLERERALDCGAGIGRITKNLLVKFFDKVDLVEQDQKFIQEAEKSIGTHENVGEFFNTGLQNLEFAHKYDVIWCQWVLGHLPESDLIKFFKNCVGHLKPNGVIVVKENLTSKGGVELDEQDSSVTRSYSVMQDLFKAADLKCIKEWKQNNFPKFLYPVMMFALRPAT
ncbi:N-terminal Xaa-Pro-Lys N-methyltransferase 1-like [Nilaparvata lugens]|uniref:N-terminal Xaa-Pro-Lys N-methyltransferase 1-like n=1 Tax=Nilaparvata lugens TaxID=108931 RepID=UPI000B994D57|nr:N-terminal Xaa-Pro-Lys N-methyltransferase 1-like [Nilaparvata lugens]